MTGPSYPQRRHPRLVGYDYGSAGAYFVTICTRRSKPILGNIRNGTCELSAVGRIVEEEWLRTPALRSNVTLDVHAVMPNHFHGVLFIAESPQRPARTTSRTLDTEERQTGWRDPPSQTLGAIMRGFKSVTTSRCMKQHLADGTIWHTQFHDHVIRNDTDLSRIREYIVTNVLRWELDRYYLPSS